MSGTPVWLLDVSPLDASDDQRHATLGHAEGARQRSLTLAASVAPPHLTDARHREFGGVVLLAVGDQPHVPGVDSVLKPGRPLQVVGTVIEVVPVLVVHAVLIGPTPDDSRGWAKERQRHAHVDLEAGVSAVSRGLESKVISGDAQAKDSPAHWPDGSGVDACRSRNRPDPAKAGDLIDAHPLRNRSPFLGHGRAFYQRHSAPEARR